MDDFICPLPTRANTVVEVNQLLEHMVRLGGSDLFLMGNSEVWVSLHGRKQKITNRRLSDAEVKNMISVIYNMSAPSMLGAGKPIDTSHEFYRETNGGLSRERFRFRVNAIGCLRSSRKSLTLTLRSIPSEPPHYTKLGIEQSIMDASMTLDQGLILLVGATGSGKSTTLASILRARVENRDGHTNLVTIEKPIEFVYDEINKPTSFVTQMQVGTDIDSFQEGVANSLRMAPNVILVGETRDYETAAATLEASMTGHGVFSTVHTNNVAETFQRMVYSFPEEMQNQAKVNIVQPMRMIVAQRLLPKVDGGRVAIREFLIIDQQQKEILIDSANLASTAFNLVQSHGRPMVEDAYDKFKDGLISQETFSRVQANYAAIKGAMSR